MPAMRQRAVSCTAGTDTALAMSTHPSRTAPGWREPPWGVDGPHRRRLGACQAPGPQGGRGHTRGDCAKRLTETLAVAACRYRTDHGCQACGLLLRLAEQQAARRRCEVGARHNGGCANPRGRVAKRSGGDTKRSFSAVTGHTLCNSPLCLIAKQLTPQHLPGWAGLDARSSLSSQRCAKRLALTSWAFEVGTMVNHSPQ